MEKLIEKIVAFCVRHDRYWYIPDRFGEGVYLERYYIFLKDRKWFPFNVVLHKFIQSDLDDLHDHPWGFATMILVGEYDETTPEGTFRRKPFQLRWANAKALHRVKLIDEKPVWTLFFVGPLKKDWGFIKNGEWVDHQTYIEEMRA